MKITDEMIKERALAKGFTLNQDGIDLRPYVYELARDLIELAQEVPDLKWFDHGGGWRSAGGIEKYHLSPRGFDYNVWITDPCIHGDPIAKINGLDAAKAYCNEHNRKRVLSQLKYGGE